MGFDYGNKWEASWNVCSANDPSFHSGKHSNSSNNYNNNDNNISCHSFKPQQHIDAGAPPLCSGHNLPARLLTANTSSNMGRQFFKCSLPEGENCDFFQWQDGMEGNWNNNNNKSNNDCSVGSVQYGEGDIRDMNEGNRRVFGHQTFRPGQKDVIEKAIQGRDVFVLMPTG
jgi:hypothetical protein